VHRIHTDTILGWAEELIEYPIACSIISALARQEVLADRSEIADRVRLKIHKEIRASQQANQNPVMDYQGLMDNDVDLTLRPGFYSPAFI